MKVLKFGGTSVGSAKAMILTADIIQQSGPCIVVCSAMSGVTNKLLEMANRAEEGIVDTKLLKEVEDLHIQTIQQLLPATYQNPSIIAIKTWLNEIEAVLESISVLKELSERSKAVLQSYGEQLSCTIITEYLHSKRVPAVYTDARKLLITSGGYNNGTLDEEKSKDLVNNWYQSIASNQIPIITGFISSDITGVTTNLGRGGSDYTASIIGAFLQADSIEIWTDVDGFYTADPRLVRKAFPLKNISYNEALELSYFGAKVIYAPTIIPAINKQIPIWIKNTFNASANGTLIHTHEEGTEPLVKGISSINDITLINIIGNGMVGFKGFSARLFSALSHAEVNVILITQASSEHTMTIAVSPTNSDKAMAALLDEFEYEIKLKVIETPEVEDNLSIVAVVGSHMQHLSGVSGKLFSALGRCGVNVSAIAQGSSELNISVVLRKADLKRSLNAIHDAMFISQYKTVHLYVMGIGSIGKELLQQIHMANERLKTQHHVYLQLAGVSNSRKMLFNAEEGIQLNNWQSLLNEYGEEAKLNRFVEIMSSHNLPNSVFVDNTANAQVASLYEKIFEEKVSVVTCNKIACSSELITYKKLKKSSTLKGLRFLYETNVGAGLPIIQTLQDLVMSGDEVLKVEAILSGTISFIFNNYKGDAKFSDIVKKAQELGYTEPDPRDDLNGLDFARKALILSREMGMETEMSQVKIDKILPNQCFEVKTVEEFYQSMKANEQGLEELKQKAEKENSVLRYIATITPEEVTIALSMVDASHPFYSLSGSDNVISFTTGRYKNNPLVVKGPGAGVAVTAAGVFADIMKNINIINKQFMKMVTAFAPATVANFVCGYDILGFALDGIGDEVSVQYNNKKENTFELLSTEEELKNLPPEKNVAFALIELVQQEIQSTKKVHITLHKKMPLNSGLGSSSASSVAALLAINELEGNKLSLPELLPLAMEGERIACGTAHADNVAPCLLGGITLVKSLSPLEVVALPVPEHWYTCVIHPHVDVPTKLARKILKPKIPLKDAVVQFGNIAGLVAGIYSNNDDLVARSMMDVLIEPHRAMLIPYFYEMKDKAIEQGAIGFGISGSGPSVFALCKSEDSALLISKELQHLLHLYQLPYDAFVSKVSKLGARIISA